MIHGFNRSKFTPPIFWIWIRILVFRNALTPFTQVFVGKNTLSLWLEILREKKNSRIYTDLIWPSQKGNLQQFLGFCRKCSPCFQKSISVKATEQALLLCCVSLCGWTTHSDSQTGNVSEKDNFFKTVQILIFFVFENSKYFVLIEEYVHICCFIIFVIKM